MSVPMPSKDELIDLGSRAFWTLIQAMSGVGAAIVMATATGVVDVDALRMAGIVSLGGGLASVMSLVRNFATNRLGDKYVLVTPPKTPPAV